MPKTLNEWLTYIYELHSSRVDLGLQRISTIAEEQGLTQFDCPVVTVGGTNGKGSCIKVLESIYTAAGYHVAAYYSPHLEVFNERICINEQPISDAELVSLFERVDAFRDNRPLSFFEFTSLAAFLKFQEAPVDVVLLEVGLGGRLDAVNVVEPDVSVVTSIGIDHCNWLGETRELIADEKAGIFRPNKPAICGDFEPPQSLIDFAKNINSELYIINKDFSYEIESNSMKWRGGELSFSQLPVPDLKCQNVATSLMVIACQQSSLPTHVDSIIKGLKNAKLTGRYEEFDYPVKGVLDVAHNADSAEWLAKQLDTRVSSRKNIAVVGLLKEKAIEKTIEPLLPYVDQWYVGGIVGDRASADPAEILAYLKAAGVKSCYDFTTINEAITAAIHRASHGNSDERVVVFGSFYTVAEARRILAGWDDQ